MCVCVRACCEVSELTAYVLFFCNLPFFAFFVVVGISYHLLLFLVIFVFLLLLYFLHFEIPLTRVGKTIRLKRNPYKQKDSKKSTDENKNSNKNDVDDDDDGYVP